LETEGQRAAGLERRDGGSHAWVVRMSPVLACGGLLIGLSVFQGEFDWGVAQFRQVWHPLLLARSSSLCLVAARPRAGRRGPMGAPAAFSLVGADALCHGEQSGVRATIALRHTDPGHAYVTAKLDPPSAAQDAEWVDGLAWQGDGLVINHMKPVGDGTWTSTKPLPPSGHWKTMLRI